MRESPVLGGAQVQGLCHAIFLGVISLKSTR